VWVPGPDDLFIRIKRYQSTLPISIIDESDTPSTLGNSEI